MPIQIVNETPLAIGFMSGRVRKSGYHLTVIVKGVFTITTGQSTFAEAKPLLEGDVTWDEDEPSSCRYPSDFAPFKPRADVTAVGTCHVGAGQRTGRAMFRFGSFQKTLLVYGDRQFISRSPGRYEMTDPLPFRTVPLRYERAFGGLEHLANPLGKGLGTTSNGQRHLPNIELPSQAIRTVDDRPEPAGFGPLDRRWLDRARKLGTYDAAWLAQRWPYFPDDFDWSYFNAAPADQQLPYLKGDEPFAFEGMHLDSKRFESRLPGKRPRCFARSQRDAKDVTEEVILVLDTVAIDVDRNEMSIVWRGLLPVRTREYDEVERALVVVEDLKDAPRPPEYYLEPRFWEPQVPSQEALGAAVDAEARGTPIEMPEPKPAQAEPDPEEVAELEQARRDLESANVDPALLDRLKGVTNAAAFSAILMANMPPPTDEERAAGEKAKNEAEQQTKAGAAEAEKIESAATQRRKSDKRELDTMRADLRAANAEPELMRKLDGETTKRGFLSVLFGSLPPPESPEDERQRKDILGFVAKTEEAEEAAELAEEAMPRAARGERLTRDEVLAMAGAGKSLEGTNLTELDLSRAELRGAQLAGANLTGARLTKAILSGADLSGANLRLAHLDEASLVGAVLQDANLDTADLKGANLTEASCAGAKLENAELDRAILEKADLTGAMLTGASLVGANLTQALFNDARLDNANLERVDAGRASFRKASLTDAKLSRAQLDGAILIECELSRAVFDGASLREAHFDGASGADASFRGALLTNVRATGVRLLGARFAKARGEKSNWSRAELTGADFEGAVLASANFTGTNLLGAIFHLARLEEANFAKAVLAAARLTRANLFRARLGGADLTGADCRASNLFECDLFEAKTAQARFERCNIERTCLAIRSGE